MQNLVDSSDLSATLAVYHSHSHYLRMFSTMMEKFKRREVVTEQEKDAIGELFNTFISTKISAATSLDEEQKRFFETNTPPFIFIEQCYDIQQRDLQEIGESGEIEGEVDDSDSDSVNASFDSNGSETFVEYKARLLENIESLFKANPIKNLSKMLQLYDKYQKERDCGVSQESDGDINDSVDITLNEDIAQLLDLLHLESCREMMTSKLAEAITNYESQVNALLLDNADFNNLTKLLEAQEKHIQNTYQYYMTVQQCQHLDHVTACLGNKKIAQRQQSNTRTPGIAIGSPIPITTPDSLIFSPDSTENSKPQVHETTLEGDTSPLKGMALFQSPEQSQAPNVRDAAGDIPLDSASSSPDSTENSKPQVHETTLEGDTSSLKGTALFQSPEQSQAHAQNLGDDAAAGDISLDRSSFPSSRPASPVKKVTFAQESPVVRSGAVQAKPQATIAQPPRPNISPSLWFLIGTTSASLVAGIVLLALASSLSSTIALAGFACIGAGILGTCTLALFTPKASQRKEKANRLQQLVTAASP